MTSSSLALLRRSIREFFLFASSRYAHFQKKFYKILGDDLPSLAAALAFYGVLSLAPLTIILVRISSLLGPDTAKRIVGQAREFFDPSVAIFMEKIFENSRLYATQTSFFGMLGLISLIVSAAGIFSQLQVSMNRIWNVRRQDFWPWLRKRVLCYFLILGFGAILGFSLALSLILSLLEKYSHWQWSLFAPLIPYFLSSFSFTMIYKILPDRNSRWYASTIAGGSVGVLFNLGKFLIGIYLKHISIASAYGASGSLLLALFWIYYSCFIVLAGAEFCFFLETRHRGNSPLTDESPTS